MKNYTDIITQMYINLLLIAITRNYDFISVMREAEAETKNTIEAEEVPYPKGFNGLYYIESAARRMGSSLGEVYGLSGERLNETILKILNALCKSNSQESISGGFCDDEEEYVAYFSTIKVSSISNENDLNNYLQEAMECCHIEDNKERKESILCLQYSTEIPYRLEIRKYWASAEEEKDIYDIIIDPYYLRHIPAGRLEKENEYNFEQFVIWEGNDGEIGEFLDNIFSFYQVSAGKDEDDNIEKFPHREEETTTEAVDNKNTVRDSTAIDVSDTKLSSSKMEVEKPVIESSEPSPSKKIVDELIEYVDYETRTVDLLDKFEDLDDTGTVYRRLVIRNGRFLNINAYICYVVERGRGTGYIGDITFTELKKGEDFDLIRYARTEITEDIIAEYKDKNKIFRFSKPYLLRAQNSTNRTGYGWTWDWSDGYGDYTEGTFYGETTNYFIVGGYISSTSYYFSRVPRNDGTPDYWSMKI